MRNNKNLLTNNQEFWTKNTVVFVGHSAKRPFPKMSFNAAKKLGKKVFAIDPSVNHINGEMTFQDFSDISDPIEGVVLELPREETLEWVEKAAKHGVRNLWIHMNTETPEALDYARKNGMNVRFGTCAVMYVTPGFSFHSIHRWIMKLKKKF